jgi:DeoR/GlpR family transcriptional regulator of sugar metabolism
MHRQNQILEAIRAEGFRAVGDLARDLSVNESTIRRHLARLENLDLIQRTHGGARMGSPRSQPVEPVTANAREKRAIGRAMADRIRDGQVVLLDSGTTTLEVAKALRNTQLTVVTNDLRIGMAISAKPRIQLVFIGGELLPETFNMWGPTAVQQLEQLSIDIAIFGADSVTEDGIFSFSSYEIEMQRTMLQIAADAYFVADSSKFHRTALFRVCDLDQFSSGITDDYLNPLLASQLPLPIIRVSTTS